MNNNGIFNTIIKTYKNKNMALFTQEFPTQCVNCSISDENKPITYFPSFVENENQNLGYLHYHGYMGGWYWQAGIWPHLYEGGM